jgi:gliding motility-associated-like protein
MRRISILLVYIVCFQYSFAATYYLSTSGNDGNDGSQGNPWRTLKHAVSRVAANQGHTISIGDGTFVENGSFVVPTGVSIVGAGIDRTIIKAASSFYYNPAFPGFSTERMLMQLTSGGLTNGNQSLRDFTLDGDGKRLHGGIYVNNRSNVLIERVKVQYTNFTGIWLWTVSDSKLKDVVLRDCSWGSTGWAAGALNLGSITRVEIDGLDVNESTGYGVKAIGPGGHNKIFNLIIHDSRVSVNPAGKWNDGKAPNISIELWSVHLQDCEIYNTYVDNHVSLVNSNFPSQGRKTIRVHHNVFDLVTRSGGSGYGLELTVNDAEVDHNYFFKGRYGIVNWDNAVGNWEIHHNVFYGIHTYWPGEVLRSQRSGFHNVKFYNNTIEMESAETSSVMSSYGGTSNNVELKNNLIINNNTGYSWFPNKLIHLEAGAVINGLQVTHNLLHKLPLGSIGGQYLNNLLVDPLISKTGARPSPYYAPVAGSPAIDKGVNVGLPYSGSAPDIGAYEYGATTTPPANALPTVAVTAPANNANFTAGATVTLTANATDSDGAISKVEFFNGSTKLGEDLTSPYNFAWTNIPAGSYTISAKATDNQTGVATSTPLNITVSNPNTPPVITLTGPNNNAVFPVGSVVNITASASDTNGAVSKVEFYSGTTKLGEDLASPYNFAWNNVPAGAHVITAKATDNQGIIATSSAMNITVNVSNNPPTVAITSPAANATFTAGSNIAMTANASDSNGSITKVEFFRGTTKLGEDLTSPYSYTWTNVPVGGYVLTAKATDNQGAVSTSTAVSITVNGANTPPIITLTSPANNASFAAGSNITISANASDANGTISKVEFYNGAAKLGEDATSPYSFVLSNAALGSYAITAKATDNQGAASTSYTANITVFSTNTPPVVRLTSPIDNSYFQPGANITLTANASDNGSVSKVEFFRGTTKLGEDLASPYSFIWNNVAEGSYIVTAKATDNQGVVAVSTAVDIVVTGSNNNPVVALTSPLDNATFSTGTSILMTANASTTSGSITKVEFFNGTNKLGEDLSSPYSFIWNSVPTGSYSLTARATDNSAAVVTSDVVSIIVSASTNAPLITITSPENNASFESDSDILISADASDPDGSVTKVEFYNGNSKLGEDASSPYSFAWNNVVAGSYEISAVATDNQGATQVDQIQIHVGDAPTANAGEDITINLPDNTVQVVGSGASFDESTLAYEWIQVSGPNDAIFSDVNSSSPTLSGLDEGIYTIELIVTDSRGLASRDQVTITVGNGELASGRIPRYFSPNNDGIQDTWVWPSVEEFANSTLTIFNESGQVIYEAVSYQNSWDGNLNGRPLQEGAYYYVIRLPDNDDDITGAVRIIR